MRTSAMQSRWTLILCGYFLLRMAAVSGDGQPNGLPGGQQQQSPSTMPRASSDDVNFELADFETEYNLNGSTALLQAYKVRSRESNNDQWQQQWVSVGYPVLARNRHGQLIRLDPEGVSVYVRTLDQGQKEALLARAISTRRAERTATADEIIRPLPLSHFSCLLRFVQDQLEYTAHGNVNDFNNSPLKLSFPMHQGSRRRTAFEKRLLVDGGLTLQCELSSSGKQERVASLLITADQMQYANLSAKLFGPANETFVSRKQMVHLSSELMSALRIEEQYDSDAEEFGESYVQGLLKLSHSTFQPVSFEQALRSLSGYGVSFDMRDLEPAAVRTELQREFHLQDVDRRTLIVPGDKSDDNRSTSLIANTVIGLFDCRDDLAFVQDRRDVWFRLNLTVDEQLAEMNGRPGASIRWARNGLQIVPKDLLVLRVGRATLAQNMKLERVKRKPTNVLFRKSYTIELDTETVGDSYPFLRATTQQQQQESQRGETLSADDLERVIERKLRQLIGAGFANQDCRLVNGSGYQDQFRNTLFLSNKISQILDYYHYHCDGPVRRNYSLQNNQGQLHLLANFYCKQGDRWEPKSYRSSIGHAAALSPVSAYSLSLLSAVCADDERLVGFWYSYHYSDNGLIVKPTARCCRPVLGFG